MEITWKRNFYFFFLLLVFKMNMCLSRTNEDDWQIIVDRWKDSGWIDGWIGGWTDNGWTEGQMGRQTDEWINHPLSLSFTLSLFLSLGSPPTLPQTLPPLSTTSSIFFHPLCQTHTNICQYDYICEGFFFYNSFSPNEITLHMFLLLFSLNSIFCSSLWDNSQRSNSLSTLTAS